MKDLDLKLNDENIKFVLKNDFINRNKYISSFIKMLSNINENRIICLDGEWGSGKTWFVKSVEYLINTDNNKELKVVKDEIMQKVKDEYMTFYYNAWENDDAASAMLSLIYKLINDSCNQKENNEVGPIPRLLNTVIKYATNGNLDIKQDLFGEQWNNKQITDSIKTSEEIKLTFREIIDNILIEQKNRLLIIIDEIDRCKPLFAIDLLENIKHFYNDDRIVFLITTNNRQLSSSVNKVYGENYDGALYLDRFFDITIELPNNYLSQYIKAIDDGSTSNNYSFRTLRELAKEYKLTMREYNRYYNAMKIINEDLIDDYSYISLYINYFVVPLAMLLKIKNKNDYYKFIEGKNVDVLKKIIETNEYFLKLGRKIVSLYDNQIIIDIHSMPISEEKKSGKEKDKILNLLEIFYNQLFNGEIIEEDDEWIYKEMLNTTLEMISLLK